MILMSPTPEIDQDTPVTTTYDPSGGDRSSRRTTGWSDWERVETLYAFARDRAVERLERAQSVGDRQTAGLERLGLHVMDNLYAQARRRDDVLVTCAVSYFRARAMRDAHHPEFLGSWIMPSH